MRRARIVAVIAWGLAAVAACVVILALTLPASVVVSTQDPVKVICTPVLGADPDYRLGVRDTGGNGMQEAIGACAASRDRSLGTALVLGVAITGSTAVGLGSRRRSEA
ncbi:hypothetical protein [Pseudoclavibacter sp. Z016]|uniref:hypothetical protein n=1 Tax=Pseudoclavibacter sp. Z016 TaxID=2080581 RepID=UPI000CE75972|nr:hypothetical protein [Pseudoclavibacter sp. Z016]PPF78433.1 hypothetical protein C5B99_00585 [Pseudoclavibacter sp. Z016]